MTETKAYHALVLAALIAATALVSLTVATRDARANTSCGILSAAGSSWVVVTKNVPCTQAATIVRALAARTKRTPNGRNVIVHHGSYTCALTNHSGRFAGSCQNGATHTTVWESL